MLKNILSLTVLLLLAMSIESCHDEAIWMDTAEITGFDYSQCACCGGFFIEIDNESYLFYEIPAGSSLEINAETVFPVNVQVNWHQEENPCLDHLIVLDEVE